MALWYKMKGAAQWIFCRKVRRPIALAQLAVCRRCEGAVVGESLGCYVLHCGPAGEDHLGEPEPTCGCLLAWMRPRASAGLRTMKLGKILLRVAVRRNAVPAGKTRCVTSCPRRKW